MQVSKQVAWLGENLLHKTVFKGTKQIPLFRDKNNIQDYILENLFVTNGRVYELDSNLALTRAGDDAQINWAKDNFKQFKAINKYVTVNNKILPQSEALFTKIINEFTKAELIWVQSVFNGKDFDNAYKTARNLAIDKDWDRALLLSNYILSKIPRHADTEVLIGRIHSWKQDHSSSIAVLTEAIRKYPTYTDAYSALLDTYYWANKSEQAVGLFKTIVQNDISSTEIEEKIARAKKQIRNNTLEKAAKEAKKEAKIASINKQ